MAFCATSFSLKKSQWNKQCGACQCIVQFYEGPLCSFQKSTKRLDNTDRTTDLMDISPGNEPAEIDDENNMSEANKTNANQQTEQTLKVAVTNSESNTVQVQLDIILSQDLKL